jgi:hypothetical protein
MTDWLLRRLPAILLCVAIATQLAEFGWRLLINYDLPEWISGANLLLSTLLGAAAIAIAFRWLEFGWISA